MSTQSISLESARVSAQVQTERGFKSFGFYRNTTFVSLMVGYAGYYLCRQNLGIAFIPMKENLGMTAIQFGWISSVGTLAYAIGKVTLGSLADSKIGGKFVFFAGLFASAVFCLMFSCGSTFAFFVLAWALSRFSQSMGWSGLINVMSHWFPKKTYGTAMGVMSISYQLGGILVSLYAGFLLARGGNWQTLFIIPSVTLILIGLVIYPFLVHHPRKLGLEHQAILDGIEPSPAECLNGPEPSYRERFKILLSDRAFLGMLGLAFILTFLRECFNVWMPAYFSEMGESASVAAFKSTIFPILGCIGTLFAGWFSDRFICGRRTPVMAAFLLALIGCLFSLGFADSVSLAAQTLLGDWVTRARTVTFLVGAAGFFLLGSYSFVGGVVALDFGGQKTSGTAAGLLDGVGYLGGTLAGVGVANLVVHMGWGFSFLVLGVFGMIGILLCGFLWKVNPK